MENINYVVISNPDYVKEINGSWGIVNPINKTTNSITFKKAFAETSNVYWYVCGY